MKKLIIVFFLVVTVNSNFGKVNTLISKGKNEFLFIKDYKQTGSVTVTWGIGRLSRNCFGLGICRMKKIKATYVITVTIPVDKADGDFFSQVSMTSDGKMKIEVDKENLKILEDKFGSKKIVLEEDFKVNDQDLLNALNISAYTLKTGEYYFIFSDQSQKYVLYL